MSRADCDALVRVEAPDGSSEEWMASTLSDEPVLVPEFQGVPPETTIVDAGGECIWTCDCWYTKDESESKALESVVTPSGKVFIWAPFPAKPLDCPDEEGWSSP